jgi:replicative DNA helicase
MTSIKQNLSLYNPGLEERFLGACLVDPQVRLDLAHTLKPSDFSDRRHAIFSAIQGYPGDNIDLVMLSQTLQGIITFAQLVALTEHGLGYVDARGCADALLELREQRAILDIASELAEIAHANMSSDERRDAAYKSLLALDATDQGKDIQSMAEIGERVYDSLLQASKTIPTQYTELNRLIGGWKCGALHTVGARTGQGKTAFLLGAATHATTHGPVLMFSLEMSGDELFKRLLVTRASVSLMHLSGDDVPKRSYQSVVDAIGELSDYPLWVDDSMLAFATLQARARRFKLQHPNMSMIAVDYLQLCQTGERHQSRYIEVGTIATGLKQLARELDVPIIAAAQLNRSVDSRSDKTPLLSDLRESGNIEQDSDTVFLLQRLSDNAGRLTPTDLIIAKNRHGPTGKIELLFDSQTISFVQGGTQ